MIVISGALVLVAAVLLGIGIFATELNLVYASIGLSLLSFAFLLVGVLQRRNDDHISPTSEAGPAPMAAADSSPAPSVAALPLEPQQDDEPATADVVDSGDADIGGGRVVVVLGRPRYHVGGCRYLADKAVEEIDIRGAQERGFTPCGVCKPASGSARLS